MGAITLASVLTLAGILNDLGGAGVAVTKVVEFLKAKHKPEDTLPPEHVDMVKGVLVDWSLRVTVDKAQAALRSTSGALRLEADRLDITANGLAIAA